MDLRKIHGLIHKNSLIDKLAVKGCLQLGMMLFNIRQGTGEKARGKKEKDDYLCASKSRLTIADHRDCVVVSNPQEISPAALSEYSGSFIPSVVTS